jgi:hypothetical protein
MEFSTWMNKNEGCLGYIAGAIAYNLFTEGRKDPKKLQRSKATKKKKKQSSTLFDVGEPDQLDPADIIDPAAKADPGETCAITPLSGYDTHIKAIQSYAHASPENFAQVLMFSPLSANVSFSRHWNNFQVLMMILKTQFPDKVTPKEIEQAVDSFNEKYHSLPASISGWKLNTVAQIWSNKEDLKAKLDSVAQKGDDEAIINELIKIPGVAPVKAGFIAQLLWGRAGCIDTHNIDIYTKAFPEMEKDLNVNQWGKNEKGTKKYVNTLRDLEGKGIKTKQLWDVWVDFVENFYKQISKFGLGSYTPMGSATEPDDPAYDQLKGIKVPKMATTTGGDVYDIEPISGKFGMGASATHLPMEPDDALKQFQKMYDKGEVGSTAARAIPFRKHARTGKPLGAYQGLGTEPALLKYFRPALTGGEVDPGVVRDIIQQRLEKGGKKAAKKRLEKRYGKRTQKDLF